MANHDYVIDNQTAPNFRADLNNALQAIVSTNSSTSAPSTTYANMMWYDTTNNLLRMRNEADDAWITLGALDQVANTFAASVLIASQAEAEAGTDNTKTMTPLRVEQHFSANEQQIGVGQTLQAPSRASSTAYQNTTGKPIFVSIISSSYSSGTRLLETSTDGVTWASVSRFDVSGAALISTCAALIPNNIYYRYSGAFAAWVELR